MKDITIREIIEDRVQTLNSDLSNLLREANELHGAVKVLQSFEGKYPEVQTKLFAKTKELSEKYSAVKIIEGRIEGLKEAIEVIKENP